MLCRSFVVGLTCLVLGCGSRSEVWEKNPTREYPFWIHPGFSAQRQGDLTQSIRSWEFALDGYLTFERVEEKNATLRFFPSNVHQLVRGVFTRGLTSPEDSAQSDRHTIGRCHFQGRGSDIEIATDISDGTFQWVSLHEIGHALGLKHSGENTVMCDVDTCASPWIMDEDLAQFRRIWAPIE